MFLRSHKPDWVYELLPFLYIVGGVLAIIFLPSALGTLSGWLLVIAGGLVWAMRRSYRRGFTSGADPVYVRDRAPAASRFGA